MVKKFGGDNMLFGNIVCATATATVEKGAQSSKLGLILMVLAWGAIIYFFFMRPQKNREKMHRELINSIEEGDEVITSSGIKGEVISTGEEFYEIRVDKGVKLTIKKNAIGALYKKKGTTKI
jgi:preprotein translocase subunit YajC